MRKHKRVDNSKMGEWLDWLCESLAPEGHKWTWRERRAYDRIRKYIDEKVA